MKKTLSLFLALLLLLSLSACAAHSGASDGPDWARVGYFTDENDNLLSVSASEEEEYPGWYVGCMLGDEIYGWYIQVKGDTLQGDLNAGAEDAEPFVVTISEEGEDGLLLTTESGENYHFTPMEEQDSAGSVIIDTDGLGEITYAREGEELVFDEEYPAQYAVIAVQGTQTYLLGARPEEGWKFMKWTKDGEDYATESEITVELSEACEFVAVFGIAGTNEEHVDLDSVTTLGEVLGLPNYGSSMTSDFYVYVFEQDTVYYRAFAAMTPEVLDAVNALDFEDEDYDARARELVSELKVERIENISAVAPTQETLDALVGKTGAELLDEGWFVYGWNLDDMEFYMDYGLFSYKVVFEGTVEDPDAFEEESIRPLVVKSVTCEGLGDAADPDEALK